MQKRRGFLPTFLALLIISSLIFVLGSIGVLSGIRGGFEIATVPLQRAVFGLAVRDSSDINDLREENMKLAAQIVDQEKNVREIAALRAQFDSWDGATTELLPASVIGREAGSFIIDKGEKAGIETDDAVVIEKNLVGVVDKVSAQVSKVKLIFHEDISFTAETAEGVVGVIKGDGTGLLFDNVVLSDKLKKDDLVITAGDANDTGAGLVPGLLVGRIKGVNREESALFQSAEVESLVDFSHLFKVFVIVD